MKALVRIPVKMRHGPHLVGNKTESCLACRNVSRYVQVTSLT